MEKNIATFKETAEYYNKCIEGASSIEEVKRIRCSAMGYLRAALEFNILDDATARKIYSDVFGWKL